MKIILDPRIAIKSNDTRETVEIITYSYYYAAMIKMN